MSTCTEQIVCTGRNHSGEPTWDVTRLFPTQGNWSEADYLALDTNQPVEFSHGFVEFLPMPTFLHQRIRSFSSTR